MQAALQGGAATSRPPIPRTCARELLLLVRSWAVAGVASDDMSNNAAIMCMIFIIRFLACEYRSNIRRLAASANASYLSVDVYVFLIKSLRRYGWGNIGGARLTVTYRRRPGSGRGFSRGKSRRCDRR
jgi:hypothetical protein